MEEKSLGAKILEIRHTTRVIRNTFENTGTISLEDLNFLISKTISHTVISEIAESDWTRWRVDVLTKDMEIEELKRQLKDALGN